MKKKYMPYLAFAVILASLMFVLPVAAFTLLECEASPNGVIVASYRRAGEVKTGSF